MSNAEACEKYRKSDKGRAAIKAARRRWAQSEKGREYRNRKHREYMKTEKGKAARKRQDAAKHVRKMTDKRALQESIPASRVEIVTEKQLPLPIVPRIPSLSEMLSVWKRT